MKNIKVKRRRYEQELWEKGRAKTKQKVERESTKVRKKGGVLRERLHKSLAINHI